MPLRAICRVEGMPARRTVYNWKARDPEFDGQLSFAAQEGCIRLVETISEQFERIVQTHPPKVARRWWNLRLRQLIRVNPRFFGVPREEGRVWCNTSRLMRAGGELPCHFKTSRAIARNGA
jgi:hypothetical protein